MTQTPRNSFSVLREITELSHEYEDLIRAEITKDLSIGELTGIAANQCSRWSGGFSIANYGEQVAREQALKIIRDRAILERVERDERVG